MQVRMCILDIDEVNQGYMQNKYESSLMCEVRVNESLVEMLILTHKSSCSSTPSQPSNATSVQLFPNDVINLKCFSKSLGPSQQPQKLIGEKQLDYSFFSSLPSTKSYKWIPVPLSSSSSCVQGKKEMLIIDQDNLNATQSIKRMNTSSEVKILFQFERRLAQPSLEDSREDLLQQTFQISNELNYLGGKAPQQVDGLIADQVGKLYQKLKEMQIYLNYNQPNLETTQDQINDIIPIIGQNASNINQLSFQTPTKTMIFKETTSPISESCPEKCEPTNNNFLQKNQTDSEHVMRDKLQKIKANVLALEASIHSSRFQYQSPLYKGQREEKQTPMRDKNEQLQEVITKYNDSLKKTSSNQFSSAKKRIRIPNEKQSLIDQIENDTKKIENNQILQSKLAEDSRRIRHANEAISSDLRLSHQLIQYMKDFSLNTSTPIDLEEKIESSVFSTNEIQNMFDDIHYRKQQCLNLEIQLERLQQLNRVKEDQKRGFSQIQLIKDQQKSTLNQFFDKFRLNNKLEVPIQEIAPTNPDFPNNDSNKLPLRKPQTSVISEEHK